MDVDSEETLFQLTQQVEKISSILHGFTNVAGSGVTIKSLAPDLYIFEADISAGGSDFDWSEIAFGVDLLRDEDDLPIFRVYAGFLTHEAGAGTQTVKLRGPSTSAEYTDVDVVNPLAGDYYHIAVVRYDADTETIEVTSVEATDETSAISACAGDADSHYYQLVCGRYNTTGGADDWSLVRRYGWGNIDISGLSAL